MFDSLRESLPGGSVRGDVSASAPSSRISQRFADDVERHVHQGENHHAERISPLRRADRRLGPLRSTAIASITVMIAAGLAVIPATAPPAAAAIAGSETFLVSSTDSGTSSEASITPDGQRVAFTSTAGDLVTGDTNGVSDVFLATASGTADPFSGDPLLVSVPDASMPQVPANGPSSHPIPSADGRYVAFLSAATNLTPGPYAAEGWTNVYVRDTVLKTTIRVEGADGEPLGNASSLDMSDDGRYVVFVSDAANIAIPYDNFAPDGFTADLDADGDGTRGDVVVVDALGFPATKGVTDIAISGNGAEIAFTAHYPLDPDPIGYDDYLYRGHRDNTGDGFTLIAKDAHGPAISSNGDVVAYISSYDCHGVPSINAATGDGGHVYRVGVGTGGTDYTLGTVAAPAVSADGSTVAWQTTQPVINTQDPNPRVVLPQPVIRKQVITWRDATTGGQCSTSPGEDVATGQSPSLSASGRTVALTGPTTLSTAPASVLAVDTHVNDGLSVATLQGELNNVGYMASVDISQIPVSQLTDYASALANAPIHHLPIHHLPIHHLPIHHLPIHHLLISDATVYRLPIHHLPIHHLPIHHLDIPGGWPELLVDTPFAGELEQTVLLGDVLDWAAEALAAGSTATDAQRAAATRIQSLTLDDVDLDDSGIDSLSLASMVLGGAPLAEIALPGTGTATEQWQTLLDAQGIALTIDGETLLADVDSAGLDIGRTGVEGAILRDLPIDDTLFDAIPLTSLFLAETPLGGLDVATLDAATQTALFGSAKTGTLEANVSALLPTATVADLAHGAPAALTFGTLLFSLLDAANYPWEQIAPSAIDPTAAVHGISRLRLRRAEALRHAVRSSRSRSTQGPANPPSSPLRRHPSPCLPGRCRPATT